MICPATGTGHRLFWMRSAWWCAECRQKIESCCEGGGCPSVTEVIPPEEEGLHDAQSESDQAKERSHRQHPVEQDGFDV